MCAPFFKVKFADFWIADQLTSLGLVLLDVEYFFCYLLYGRNLPGKLIHYNLLQYITCLPNIEIFLGKKEVINDIMRTSLQLP